MLKVKNLQTVFLSKQQRKFLQIVQDVSFSVEENTALGILGESGCGKSTVADSIMGVLSDGPGVVSGEIWPMTNRDEPQNLLAGLACALTDRGDWRGRHKITRDIAWRKAYEKRMKKYLGSGIALMPQGATTALSPFKTIRTQLEKAYQKGGGTPEQMEEVVKQILAVLNLADMADKYPYQLSGGACQRAVIGSIFALNPSILIADEPTTGLDITLQNEIARLLTRFKHGEIPGQTDKPHTLLVISHDLRLIAQVADRVAVMYAGEIVETGDCDIIRKKAAKHPYTKQLIEVATLSHQRGRKLPVIKGEVPPPEQPPPPRFSVELAFQNDLDARVISEELRQMFANNGSALNRNAHVKGKSPLWRITDENQTYIVRREKKRLNIYPQQKGCKFYSRCELRLEQCQTKRPDLAEMDTEPGHEVRCPVTLNPPNAKRQTPDDQLPSLHAEQQEVSKNQQSIDPLLSIQHLNFSYPTQFGDVKLKPRHSADSTPFSLQDICLDIYPGESVGLIGESTGGKSTLGKLLVGLYPPTSGLVKLKGRVLEYSESELDEYRKSVQMIWQSDATLNPGMKVKDLIIEAIGREGEPTEIEKMNGYLEMMNLTGKEDAYPETLSGGEQRRISIIRTLARSPELIIADEPFAGLDASLRNHLVNVFQKLKAEKRTAFLFILHDLDIAKYICDRVAVICSGRIVEIGASEQLFNAPNHPYTKTLVDAVAKYTIR